MHMRNNYATPIVVKYGGNAMGFAKSDPVLDEAARLHKEETALILVHGGGPEIDRWLGLRGVRTERIDGLRVTDAVTLEVTEAVLCATINKRLVRELASRGVKAAGISGEDGGLLRAVQVRASGGEDLGFVGGETHCDAALLELLLSAKFLPVVAPLALGEDASTALNVNADLAAAAIAAAVNACAFVQITNVPRVRSDPNDPSSAIEALTLDDARAFAASPACSGGMRPKIEASIAAVEGGAACAYICAAGPDAISRALQGDATRIGV
jgi:acetylglutamate kinase